MSVLDKDGAAAADFTGHQATEACPYLNFHIVYSTGPYVRASNCVAQEALYYTK